jgi:hypothetical protein
MDLDDSAMRLTTENSLYLAKFMQSRQARRFVRKNGFPKKLSFVRPKSHGFRDDDNLMLKVQRVELNRDFDLPEGNYLETEKGNVIKLSCGFKGDLLGQLLNVMPRERLTFDEVFYECRDFDKMLREYPIFNSDGECRYVANLFDRRPKNSLSIPDHKTRVYWNDQFRVINAEAVNA